jgi:hypothetical protein
MSDVGDKVPNDKAVDQRAEGVLHEGRRIKVATVAYRVLGAKNEVRNTWSHEARQCQKSEICMVECSQCVTRAQSDYFQAKSRSFVDFIQEEFLIQEEVDG